MKKPLSILTGVCLAAALVLPVAAHALPTVQRTASAVDATQLPAVQSDWFMALLAQLKVVFGG